MNTLVVFLGKISLAPLEIIILQIGAVVFGIAIHFFLTSRRSMNSVKRSATPIGSGISEAEEWRLKYYEQVDIQQKLEDETRNELGEMQEKEHLLTSELQKTKIELKTLLETPEPEVQPELATAQVSLSDHNPCITRLLEQIDLLKESERKHLDTKHTNESLQIQLRDFKQTLSDKETEIKQLRQQQLLIHELRDRLEKAHDEYNVLQDKLQNLEAHISKPQNRTFEYDELEQSYFKLTKECDEIKMKQLAMFEENQRLSRLLNDTDDKLSESNFQRQQLSRKVTFLEELNHDLQELSGHHKKLESQMRRIGEIEMMLNRTAGENS